MVLSQEQTKSEFPVEANIEQQLRCREVSRERSRDSETVIFDTGQKIIRQRTLIDNPNSLAMVCGKPKSTVIETVIENTRTGHSFSSNPGGGQGSGRERGEGYPELSSFIDEINKVLHSSKGILDSSKLNWKRAREYFASRDMLINPSEVKQQLDAMVVCVFPDYRVRALVFNPKQLACTTKAKDTRKQPVIPDRRNSLFEISWQSEKDQIEAISLIPYSYGCEKFNAVDKIDLENIEVNRGPGFYIKVDTSLMDVLERVAPLPIEFSDCGVALGYPELNERYSQACNAAHLRHHKVRPIAMSARYLISQMNDSDQWIEIDSFRPERNAFGDNPVYLMKDSNTDTSEHGSKSVRVLPIYPQEVENAQAIVRLEVPELKMIGLKGAESLELELESTALPDSKSIEPKVDNIDFSASTISLPRNKELEQLDQDSMIEYVLGSEPDLTPLIDRRASLLTKMREYNWHVIHSTFGLPHYHGPICELITKAYGIIALFNPASRASFVKNGDEVRECALLERGNERAYEYGVLRPLNLVYQGKLNEALGCYPQACANAPHRIDDIYQTLANLCTHLHLWQRGLRNGSCKLELECEEFFGFNGFGSLLSANRITTSSGDYSSFSFVRGQSYVPDTEYDGVTLLKKSLLETEIPFSAIARAAYRRILSRIEDRSEEHGESRDDKQESLLFRHKLAGLIAWLSDDYDTAIPLLKNSLEKNRDSSMFYCFAGDMDPYVWALRDGGYYKEAICFMGPMLVDVTNGPSQRHYIEFLELCQMYALNAEHKTTKWELALPFIKAVIDREEEVFDGCSATYNAMLGYKFLSQCYDGVGKRELAHSASKRYKEISESLQRWNDSY